MIVSDGHDRRASVPIDSHVVNTKVVIVAHVVVVSTRVRVQRMSVTISVRPTCVNSWRVVYMIRRRITRITRKCSRIGGMTQR